MKTLKSRCLDRDPDRTSGHKNIKVVFSGGGTLGSVTPLLAIYDVIKEKRPEAEFVWVGTKKGPERELIEQKGIKFLSFFSGKLRRYFSILNIFDFFRVIVGFFQAIIFLKREKPNLCISAGGFVSVPLHWAAKFTKIPTWIHQQDVRVGLANRLMSKNAKVITVAVEENLSYFSKDKVIYVGNPVRAEVLQGDKERAFKLFGLSGKLPVVFAMGGGTGSESVNGLVVEAAKYLKGVCEIIHLTGKKRSHEETEKTDKELDYYKTYDIFIDEMKDAYAVADLVISRGGYGTLTELSALKKPAIIIPIPGHQEENVAMLAKSGAVILVNQDTANGLKLARIIENILKDKEGMENIRKKLARLVPIATKENILNIFEDLINK